MGRKNTHTVTPRKNKKDLRVVISAEKLRQIAKGQERELRKQNGTLFISGSGAHGNDKAENRRDRRDSRKQLTNYKRGFRDDE
jgi:hypothetical protein